MANKKRQFSEAALLELERMRTKRFVIGRTVRAIVGVAPWISIPIILLAAKDLSPPAVRAIAGALVEIFGGPTISVVVGGVVLTCVALFGRLAWRHANRRVESLHARVQNAERLEDKHRSSAKLTASGETLPQDKE